MPARSQKPLLNVLDRQLFVDWLEARAAQGDVAGETGANGQGNDPIDRFLSDVVGWEGHCIRFEYVRDDAKRTHYRLPGWAVEFQELVDKEPIEDTEEDGVTTLISADRCLELMETIE